jgi:tripartite-type tricarboxylate transporter receptor subunit TctC
MSGPRCIAALVAVAISAVLPLSATAQSQSYPSRPITLIIPFAAGGPSDTVGRITADHMSRTLGQQLIVENVAGAGGTLGAERAAKAAPDGYTLFQHHSALPAAHSLYANLRYDTRTAFETIGLINTGPMVLTSRKNLEVKDARSLMDWLRERGDKATVAQAGVGSNSYLCALLLSQVSKAKFSMVPYRGTGPAMQDLVSGQIDILCDQATTATPQIQSGTIKAYAVTSRERLPALKDVPSSVEAGLTGFDMVIWNGFYAPRGTPKPMLDTLHGALQKMVEDPKIIERFAQTGTVPFPPEMRSPAAHRKFLDSEIERFAQMVKAAGVKQEEAK